MAEIQMSAVAATFCAAIALSAPADACRRSRAVFTTTPYGVSGVSVPIRAEEAYVLTGDQRPIAIRATVRADTGVARRGDTIVIVIPRGQSPNCYYYGFAEPGALQRGGTLVGYIDVRPERAASGAFVAAAAESWEPGRYAHPDGSERPGRWVRNAFR